MISDVLVIGGGPAGASCAALLAMRGFDVTLIDRAAFPRDKACGEFLNPEAWRLLTQRIGLSGTTLAEAGCPVGKVSLYADQTDPIEVALRRPNGEPDSGWSVRRTALDAALLKHAAECGVEVRQGTAARELIVEDGAVVGLRAQSCEGPGELRARLVIAADGSHSIAARQLGLVRPIAGLQQVAAVAHFVGAAQREPSVRLFAPSHMGRGFSGGFTLQGGGRAVLSLVAPQGAAKQLANRQSDFVFDRVDELAAIHPDLRGAELAGPVKTTSCFGHTLSSVAEPGLLLLGDAACFIDPFTGEGLHHAFEAALHAADVAETALHSGDASKRALQPYAARRAQLGRRYLLCRIIRFFLHRPRLMETLARNLKRNPWAAERIIGAATDLLPPEAPLHPRFLWSALRPV